MKSDAIRKTGVVFILFTCLWLAGCTTPYAIVHLKPFPDTEAESEIIEPDYPDIQEALTIINSELTKNGYVETVGWSTAGEGNTSTGWWLAKNYNHQNPFVDVTVYNQGTKQSTSERKAGKRSVLIYVDFREPNRWFLKEHPDVKRVREEIAAQLGKRFGQEKVTTEAGRIGSELM